MKKSTVTTAMRKRADRLAWRLRGTELEQQAAEFAERIRQSEALAKAQAKAEALAKARAKTEALAAKAQAQAEKLATQAQAKAEELAGQAQRKGTELATKAQTRKAELAERVGERLAEGRAGEVLGLQRRRRVPLWLIVLGGVAGGYVIALLIESRRRDQATPSLVETIHHELTNDPRTAELPHLKVNVAGGTVFVRGTIPVGFNEDTLREVISRVPGVDDVDLQVTAA